MGVIITIILGVRPKPYKQSFPKGLYFIAINKSPEYFFYSFIMHVVDSKLNLDTEWYHNCYI